LRFFVAISDIIRFDVLLMLLACIPTMVTASAFATPDDAFCGAVASYHVCAITAALWAWYLNRWHRSTQIANHSTDAARVLQKQSLDTLHVQRVLLLKLKDTQYWS